MTAGTIVRMSDYQKEWHRYKELRKQFLIVWLGSVPVYLIATDLLKNSALLYFAAITWIGLFFVAGFRFRLWSCPRCGKPFAGYLIQPGGLFRRRCVNCGLDRFSVGPTSQPRASDNTMV